MLNDRSSVPPVMSTLGMEIVKCEEGKATLGIRVDRRFHNPMGTVRGGIMTDLADAAMRVDTTSTFEDGESFTTLELKINFLRPVVEGELTADAKVVHRARTIAVAEVLVRTQEGKEFARGTATQMVLRSQEPR